MWDAETESSVLYLSAISVGRRLMRTSKPVIYISVEVLVFVLNGQSVNGYLSALGICVFCCNCSCFEGKV